MDLEQVLKTAIQLVEQIRGKEKELDFALGEVKNAQIKVADRANILSIREENVGRLENAAALLEQAKNLQAQVAVERETLENDRVAFQNEMTAARQELKEESDALHPMRELAEQVRQDKAALEIEKATYKEKIKNEILNQLKAGKI